jgi:protease-4
MDTYSNPAPQSFPPPPPPGYMPQQGPHMPLPYRQPRPRTGMWRTLGLLLFIGVIGFNILIFMAMFAGGGIMGGGGDRHGIAEHARKGGGPSVVAVIPVEGVIIEGGGGLFSGGGVDPVALVEDGLRKAARDSDVSAVIIEVNSPGGGVTASDTIHQAIIDFREETGKPVVIYMKDLAASGGYYISAPADHIVANRTTLTGSIGVIIQGFNLHGTLTEILKGRDATIKAGGNKSMGGMFVDPESKEYDEGRALLQELVDEMHGTFKSVVREGRGAKLKEGWETYADGRVMTASKALEIGLIDQIGYFQDAVDVAAGLSGVSDPAVVEYGREMGLGALLGLSSEELDQMKQAGAMAFEERMSQRLQAQLRLYPGRPMAIWVP